jgi:hypothetical protein
MPEVSDLQTQLVALQQQLAVEDLAAIDSLLGVVSTPDTTTISQITAAFQTCLGALGDPARIADLQQIITTYGQFSGALQTLRSQTNAAAGG